MRTGATFAAASPAMTTMQQEHEPYHSGWQSPVPYLFGGLAAMLGLIAFALLILACSYWKLSGYLEGDRDGAADDPESGDADTKPRNDAANKAPAAPCQDHVVVFMDGDEKLFLATPISSRASSFNDQKHDGDHTCDECKATDVAGDDKKNGDDRRSETSNHSQSQSQDEHDHDHHQGC